MEQQPMTMTVFYHGGCGDGSFAAWLFKTHAGAIATCLGLNVEFVLTPFIHAQHNSFFLTEEDKFVICLDMCPPAETILTAGSKILCIDHHAANMALMPGTTIIGFEGLPTWKDSHGISVLNYAEWEGLCATSMLAKLLDHLDIEIPSDVQDAIEIVQNNDVWPKTGVPNKSKAWGMCLKNLPAENRQEACDCAVLNVIGNSMPFLAQIQATAEAAETYIQQMQCKQFENGVCLHEITEISLLGEICAQLNKKGEICLIASVFPDQTLEVDGQQAPATKYGINRSNPPLMCNNAAVAVKEAFGLSNGGGHPFAAAVVVPDSISKEQVMQVLAQYAQSIKPTC